MTQNAQDWNINKGFGDLLTELIDNVNKSAKSGDVRDWFNDLRILYRNVAGHKKIKVDVRNKIDDKLHEVMKLLDQSNALTPTGQAFLLQQEHKTKEKLDEINIMLITEMHHAGLILPVQRRRPEYASMEI